MRLSSTFVYLLSLASSALSCEIRAFTEPNCEGNSKVVNVWDNTCRDSNLIPTRSFEVLAYGAHRQRAIFYSDDFCFWVPGMDKQIWWADGGGFKKGECVNIDFIAKAFGSQSA